MEFDTLEKKVCYGIGRQLGKQIQQQSFEGYSVDALFEGIRDTFENKDLQVPNEELNLAFASLQAKFEKIAEEEGKKFREEGEKFLAENGKKSDVITTSTGLQYQILKEGDGERPGPKDIVRVHYHGSLISGKVFDSSVQRGEPAEFPVNGVIPGWVEALQLMKVGSKYKLFIPQNLAYGSQGAGASIPPYSALIFEVELLDIAMKSKE